MAIAPEGLTDDDYLPKYTTCRFCGEIKPDSKFVRLDDRKMCRECFNEKAKR